MHDHHIENNSKKLFISIALTALIFIAEFGGGLWTGSLALLSDSAHVFMDAFALGLSYLAIRAAALPANDRHTYGYHRMQVLAALANGATLLFISFEILRDAINRFQNPEPVMAGPMLVIAVIGLIVNIIVALVLREHDHEDLNTRAAFLHVLGDALASVGVIGAGIAILFYRSAMDRSPGERVDQSTDPVQFWTFTERDCAYSGGRNAGRDDSFRRG